MTPRIIIAIRDRDGIVRSATCDMPDLPHRFSGALTIHCGEGYPSEITRPTPAVTMERRAGERRAGITAKCT